MTTTNDGGIHPMVLKAARTLFAEDMGVAAEDAPGEWESISLLYIEKAQAALAECGALECLEALCELHDATINNLVTSDELRKSGDAIAKVYGSAP